MKEVIQIYLDTPWRTENNLAIASVVMITEGIHNGSIGPVYWPGHVLAQNAEKWEGVPVTLDHPLDSDGDPISIEQSDAEIIGHVRRPYFDLTVRGIKAEIEVCADHPKLKELQKIQEVSVGVFSDHTETFGVHDGDHYDMSAITMEPDHLALLSELPGACSWADGCGIRVNSWLKEIATGAAKILIQQTLGHTDEVRPLYPVEIERELDKKKQPIKPGEVKPMYPPGVTEPQQK